MRSSFIHILSDFKTLDLYESGEYVTLDKIKSNLFLLQRSENKRVPDHYYKSQIQEDFKNVHNLSDLLLKSFATIFTEFLRVNENSNIVEAKTTTYSEWQNIISFIPPLVLQCRGVYAKFSALDNMQLYYDKYLVPNFLYTAIPKPDFSESEFTKIEFLGFNELHLHLNGSVEIDNAWQDLLGSPDKIYKDLKNGYKKNVVQEHLEQDSHLLKPYKFYKYLLSAANIRRILYELMFNPASSEIKYILNQSKEQLLNNTIFQNKPGKGFASFKHPFSVLISRPQTNISQISVEALMYVCVFDHLSTNVKHKELVAVLFHIYLLIQGLANKILVQQENQYGFDQFQKHTLNKLRDLNEITFHQRFFQMSGNRKNYFNHLEGRFSPKNSEIENVALLSSISRGWRKFEQGNIPKKQKFNLIAHFIKNVDDNSCPITKYRSLRLTIFKQAFVLDRLLKKPPYNALIVGIDAAANELHTPPEVFSPIFRRLRRKNKFLKHTYHAGEDFYHPISGLRAIYEALIFLELGENDRIGHATASGISWLQWKKELGDSILIKKGEWLDNLAFMYDLISQNNDEIFGTLQENIVDLFVNLCEYIYNMPIPIDEYIESWKNRMYCPILLSIDSYEEAFHNIVFDSSEWQKIKDLKKSKPIVDILNLYNRQQVRKRYDEFMELEIDGLINELQFEKMQLIILKRIKVKNVLLETLPTSNVRISHYKNHSEHHILQWLNWKEKGNAIPEIVIGSDDTGIFSTNIHNEYMHVYSQLNSHELLKKNAITYMQEIINSSDSFFNKNA